jgi:hypothetical protein
MLDKRKLHGIICTIQQIKKVKMFKKWIAKQQRIAEAMHSANEITQMQKTTDGVKDYVIDGVKESIIKRVIKTTWVVFKLMVKISFRIIKGGFIIMFDLLQYANAKPVYIINQDEKTYADRHTESSSIGDMVRKDFEKINK